MQIRRLLLSLLRNNLHEIIVFLIVLFFFYCYRSDSRKKNLKEAFDRMVQFHEDMINALTWLTSAESKVAELDSAVEATSTEEQQDMEALRKELKVRLILLLFRFFKVAQ